MNATFVIVNTLKMFQATFVGSPHYDYLRTRAGLQRTKASSIIDIKPKCKKISLRHNRSCIFSELFFYIEPQGI
jgi:hypothetical protein